MIKKTLLILFTAVCSLATFGVERADIIVTKDNSGDFKTIMEAVSSISANNTTWKTILIKEGVYDEHVMIKNNFIALVGEGRGITRIEHNLSRTAWYNGEGNKANTGCGVINIWTNCHDIVIANMTVKNTYNYNSDSGDDYTEVIRSETGTTKIWVVNTDALCKWKDTFALWGKDNGMYYVNDCRFRGGIDAFCPRGWCYAINCSFTETRDSSPIWLEGVSGLNQKLVIQGGSVHSEKNKSVKLQNQQGSPSFYYLDMIFSDSIASQGTSGPAYYYNVKGNSAYTFFKNNLTLDERKPIDAKWTFTSNNTLMWNPEDDMPAVLPFASLPQPYHKQYCINTGTKTLKWISGRNATSHKVYFGTTVNPEFKAQVNGTSYDVTLETGKVYYWRVDVVTDEGEIRGDTWVFTTNTTSPPDPADGNIPPNVTLDIPSTLTYDAPATVQFTANASDQDGTVKKVSFYANNTLMGTSTDAGNYSVTYTFAYPGTFVITAKAYDDFDAVTTSSPVTITVKGTIPEPNPEDIVVENFDGLTSSQLATGSDVSQSFTSNSLAWSVTKSRLNTSSSNSKSGNNSIRLYYDGNGTITTPDLYGFQTVSFWVKSKDGKTTNFEVAASVDGSEYSTVYTGSIASSTYQEVKVPITESGKVKLKITNKGGASGSTDYCLYVDDFSFAPYKAVTGINSYEIGTKKIISLKYFNLSGIEVPENTKGCIIKQTVYDDKSIAREKIMK